MSGKRSDEHPVTAYYRYHSIGEFKRSRRLEGPFRVIVFCLLAIFLPCILLISPLYIRYEVYKDVTYHLGESDLVTVDRPISTFWCSGQELWMNATFHAYLLDEKPQISEDLKQIEMKKHMQLADDSLEYWGFFLLQGSKVTLSVCSRFDGARLMVVKGTKNLKHCALIDSSRKKDQIDPWEEDVSAPQGEKIEVTFQQGEVLSATPKKNKAPNPKFPFPLNTSTIGGGIEVNTPKIDIFLPPNNIQSKDEVEVNNSAKRSRPGRRRKQNLPVMILNDEITSRSKGAEPQIETLHKNLTILNHQTPHPVRQNRTRRFIITEDKIQNVDLDEANQEQEVYETDELGTDDEMKYEDLPPNPVGIEPPNIIVENQAQNHEPETLGGEHEDEEIDEEDIRSSGSSFAKNLWSCYGGDTLFTQTFSPSPRCQSQDAMMKYVRMKMVHEVTSTGYYYYIFYSDNDIVSNDIFARFNIEKVEYSFPNYTNSCLNSTHCSLPLAFFSSEKVLLEVPLQDGVSDEDALAQMVLISTCRPRLGVYLIFPIAIIFFILSCAFM